MPEIVPLTVAKLSRIGAAVTIRGSSIKPSHTPNADNPVGVAMVAAAAERPAMMPVAMAIFSKRAANVS